MTNATLPECSRPEGHYWVDIHGRHGIESASGNYSAKGQYRCKHCYLRVPKLPAGTKVRAI